MNPWCNIFIMPIKYLIIEIGAFMFTMTSETWFLATCQYCIQQNTTEYNSTQQNTTEYNCIQLHTTVRTYAGGSTSIWQSSHPSLHSPPISVFASLVSSCPALVTTCVRAYDTLYAVVCCCVLLYAVVCCCVLLCAVFSMTPLMLPHLNYGITLWGFKCERILKLQKKLLES